MATIVAHRPQPVRERIIENVGDRRPFIAVYRSGPTDDYFIYAAMRRSDFTQPMDYIKFRNLFVPPEYIGRLDLVSVKRVPGVWSRDIRSHVMDKAGENGIAPVGYVSYAGTQGFASAETYYPRDELSYGSAKRIAYFIEALTANQVRRNGAAFTTAGFEPSDSRKAQLERVGLPSEGATTIREWMRGLGRGIRERIAEG
ncbi:MAG: hypothetical protein KGH69_04370 [Candidatus Micrarchaeota archaeon]|nr:hypothetical protein [Candidatus Micrarchaeota archaeon]